MANKAIPAVQMLSKRFWASVQIGGANQCWPWLGARAGQYGVFNHSRGERDPAHRFALMLHDGRSEKIVRHLCDNPICCNPNHLAWGDDWQNLQDRLETKAGRLIGLHPRVRVRPAGRAVMQAAYEAARARKSEITRLSIGADHG